MLEIGQLREIQENELELMLSWRNFPNVRSNMYTRNIISFEEHMQWWAKVQARQDQRYFMYECDSVPLGIVGFTQIDSNHSNASWAFYASPEAPKGTGGRMEFLALEYAFKELKLHKLHCEVLAFNQPVIKMHKKFGFEVEGVWREHHFVDGEFVDIYRLGVLGRDWLCQNETIYQKITKAWRKK